MSFIEQEVKRIFCESEQQRQIKINFDGGDLSSDAGLLLIKEFISKLGIDKLLDKTFKTNDPALFRYHTDQKNLLQMIYMIIAGYFEDDASDELTNDPVFKSVLEKDALASQPTVSRFFNRMDEDTLNQFLVIDRVLRKKIYSIQMPQAVILDLDSTLLDAYGRQEGRAYNFHYQSNGYHPLVCYDGMTGDLIKIQLRDGTQYSCTEVVDFLQPVLDEYLHDYPEIPILLRGDSGFSTPDLVEAIRETLDCNLVFHGNVVSVNQMIGIMMGSIAVFGIIYYVVTLLPDGEGRR